MGTCLDYVDLRNLEKTVFFPFLQAFEIDRLCIIQSSVLWKPLNSNDARLLPFSKFLLGY